MRACDKLQLMIKVSVYESWGQRGWPSSGATRRTSRTTEFATVAETFARLRERFAPAAAPTR